MQSLPQPQPTPDSRPSAPTTRPRAGSRAWIPRQHGAWPMLLLPPLVGAGIGGFHWLHLLLIVSWLCGYSTYWAWTQWLRTRSPRKRRLLLVPMSTYTAMTSCLGLITLRLAPYLLWWIPVFTPLMALALWEVWRGRERSLLSGVTTTTAASLLTAVSYSVSVNGDWAARQPGSSPDGLFTGWAWVWIVTALLGAYFGGTVPYIKSMIRERGNLPLLYGQGIAHTLCALVVVWAAWRGHVSMLMGAVWVLLAVRAWVMPLWQWSLVRRRHRPLRPGILGVSELIASALLVTALAV